MDSLDASKLSDADKRELSTFVQNEQQKANVQESIHTLATMCFNKCITSAPRDGKLDRYEEPCVQNCVGRFMDTTGLVIKHLERMRGGM